MNSPNFGARVYNILLPWLDILAISAWGILILKYWFTGKLSLLIHPNYFMLALVTGIILIIISIVKINQLWQQRYPKVGYSIQHITIFPPGWGSTLLLATAVLGFVFTPQVFASDKAMQKGINDLLGSSRIQPQSFRVSVNPEGRSLIDWIRTLNVYPEPDAYVGQKAKIQGFVIHPQDFGDDFFLLARFVITCCAADAYPVGLPVKVLTSGQGYKPDSWLEVKGTIGATTLLGKRQLIINASSLKKIPQPNNPYEY